MKKVILAATMVTLFCFNSNSSMTSEFGSRPEIDFILTHKPPNPWAESVFSDQECGIDLVAKSEPAMKVLPDSMIKAYWVTETEVTKEGERIFVPTRMLHSQERLEWVPVSEPTEEKRVEI